MGRNLLIIQETNRSPVPCHLSVPPSSADAPWTLESLRGVLPPGMGESSKCLCLGVLVQVSMSAALKEHAFQSETVGIYLILLLVHSNSLPEAPAPGPHCSKGSSAALQPHGHLLDASFTRTKYFHSSHRLSFFSFHLFLGRRSNASTFGAPTVTDAKGFGGPAWIQLTEAEKWCCFHSEEEERISNAEPTVRTSNVGFIVKKKEYLLCSQQWGQANCKHALSSWASLTHVIPSAIFR